MDEITQQVVDRTGLPEDQARAAVETTVGFLRDRLPEPARSMLDQALGGGQASGVMGQAAEAAGDLFNRDG